MAVINGMKGLLLCCSLEFISVRLSQAALAGESLYFVIICLALAWTDQGLPRVYKWEVIPINNRLHNSNGERILAQVEK